VFSVAVVSDVCAGGVCVVCRRDSPWERERKLLAAVRCVWQTWSPQASNAAAAAAVVSGRGREETTSHACSVKCHAFEINGNASASVWRPSRAVK